MTLLCDLGVGTMARLWMTRGEVFLQQPVDEDGAATDLTEGNALDCIFKEILVAPKRSALADEDKTEDEVLETCKAAVDQPGA